MRLAGLVDEAFARSINPHGFLVDELRLAGSRGAPQNSVHAAMANIIGAQIEAHLQTLARAAQANFGRNLFEIGHVFRNHLGVTAKTTRRDDHALRVELGKSAVAFARKNAANRTGIIYDELLGGHVEHEFRPLILGELVDGRKRIHAAVLATRLALDRVFALQQNLILERNAQFLGKPVDGFAEMVCTELLYIVIELITIAREEILEQRLGRIVLNSGALLHGVARAIKTAQANRTRPRKPTHLFKKYSFRASLGGLAGRRRSRAAAAKNHNIVVVRLFNLCLRSIFRRAARQTNHRRNRACGHNSRELTARQRIPP